MITWSENDDLFRQELAQGFKWQLHVAQYLINLGFQVEVPKLRFRDNIKQASEYADEPDILWEDRIFEVKSRKIPFTCPEDFPYETILVDTVNGWNSKIRKPNEYLCVSTETGCIICLGGETSHLWSQSIRYDHTRGIQDVFFEAHKSLWVPVETLVSQMKCHQTYRGLQESVSTVKE